MIAISEPHICSQLQAYEMGFAFVGICEAARRDVNKEVVQIAAPRSAYDLSEMLISALVEIFSVQQQLVHA